MVQELDLKYIYNYGLVVGPVVHIFLDFVSD